MAVPFDSLGESSSRSEKLVLDFRECLFYPANGFAQCGNCKQDVSITSAPINCANERCNQTWQYLVVDVTSPRIDEPWLTIYSRSAVRDPRHEAFTDRVRDELVARSLGMNALF